MEAWLNMATAAAQNMMQVLGVGAPARVVTTHLQHSSILLQEAGHGTESSSYTTNGWLTLNISRIIDNASIRCPDKVAFGEKSYKHWHISQSDPQQ